MQKIRRSKKDVLDLLKLEVSTVSTVLERTGSPVNECAVDFVQVMPSIYPINISWNGNKNPVGRFFFVLLFFPQASELI